VLLLFTQGSSRELEAASLSIVPLSILSGISARLVAVVRTTDKPILFCLEQDEEDTLKIVDALTDL
jgi:hypothetical protein